MTADRTNTQCQRNIEKRVLYNSSYVRCQGVKAWGKRKKRVFHNRAQSRFFTVKSPIELAYRMCCIDTQKAACTNNRSPFQEVFCSQRNIPRNKYH